ncbi:MAG: hypothetical protein AAF235_11905 [Planctomycetota bacterium]
MAVSDAGSAVSPSERSESDALNAGIEPLTRDEARDALRISDDAFVVAPLADDPRTIDAGRLLFLMGVLELIDRPHIAIVPDAAHRFDAAERFRMGQDVRSSLARVQGPACRYWPAADAIFELDGSMRALRGSPAEASLERYCQQIGVPMYRSLGLPDRENGLPAVVDSLWWRVREGAPPLIAHERP